MAAAMTIAVSAVSCSAPANDPENVETVSDVLSAPANKLSEEQPTEAVTREPATEAVTGTEAKASASYDGLFSKRDLDPSYSGVTASITLDGASASVDGSGAEASGSSVTISSEGVYLISGFLSDGQIIVDADKAKVQLVLDNADITCTYGPSVIGKASDKIFLTLAEGSTNRLSGGIADSDAPACIYTSDSLTVNGRGSLDVKSGADGIHSKDDIVITGGTINIDAESDGISGKDYVAAADGTVTVTAGKDGIRSTNEKEAGMGFIYIEDGTFSITSDNDGIQAFSDFIVKNGSVTVTSGGGSSNSTKTHNEFGFGGGDFGGGFDPSQFSDMTPPDFSDFDFSQFGGDFDPSQFGDMTPPDFGDFDPSQHGQPGGFGGRQEADGRSGATEKNDSQGASLSTLSNMAPAAAKDSGKSTEESSSESTKGIKAGNIDISGGSITVDSADDALHSDGDLSVSGGTLSLEAGDDGIHAESRISITDGAVIISGSYEGIEAAEISVSGGSVSVKASDDGINASDGTSQGGMGRYSSGAAVNISGGFLYVDADGDGIDSNGDMTVSGGMVIVNGPTNNGNGALDCNGEITVNGGIVIAAGSSGMAEYPGDKSAQYSVSATFESTLEAGTLVTLLDGRNREILSFAPAKTFSNIVISTPDITEGEAYTIHTGGTTAADSGDYGLSSGGYMLDGKEAGSFTADKATSVIGSRSGGGMGGFGGGRPGGRDGQSFQPTTDENGEIQKPDGGFGKGRRNRPSGSEADN